MRRLDGKTAIITGGSGGIGKITAEVFLKEGANVVLVDLNEETLNQAKAELEALGPVIAVSADVTNEEDVKKYVNETMTRFGRIDIFFNNAGIEGKINPLMNQTVEDFERVMNVNVKGVFLGLKYVLPIMIEQRSGSVINTSSVAGLMGFSGLSPYVASKHAVVGLTKTAALEAADKNVRVNSIHPAPINTRMMRSVEAGMNSENPESVKEAFTSAIPLGRYGEPIDVANLVLFLASDESKFITGAQFRVDGGMGAS
jgi:3alpha(or 20beta)-hydroxysteroid dehydrogenase